MNNGRFATALHILTLLHHSKDEWVSSDYLAGSININPVIVRRELGHLRELGLIESKEGKGGGSTLLKPAKDIRLSEIYEAVSQQPVLGRSNQPNPACPVGKRINKHLDELYEEVEAALLKKLGQTTLADFTRKFS